MGRLDLASSAEVHILFNGYADSHVASTVSFVRDGDVRVIIDPGMVPDQSAILKPLGVLGETAEGITDVIFSHHHPDHTLNAALFPNARFHDCWAIYKDDIWQDRPAEGFQISPAIQLIETPGHTPQDITTLVGTSDGIVAFTHLWWSAEGPEEDPLATDLIQLHANRERVLSVERLSLIVPGHGAAFTPGEKTPH